jgi:hypothetical protein
VGVGDFNNDGKADVVWRHTVIGQNAVCFWGRPLEIHIYPKAS